jgi:GlpG protein
MVGTPLGQQMGGMYWLTVLTFQSWSVDAGEAHMLLVLPPIEQLWRYWTPMFLHFSFSHILFNGLIFLDISRRIEAEQGATRLLGLVCCCGFISNVAQFKMSPDALFGGLSGVVFALIAYGWLFQRLQKNSPYLVAPGLMVMALFWQVLCFSGVVTWAGMGNIANTAHIAGLLSGLLFAWFAVQIIKSQRL